MTGSETTIVRNDGDNHPLTVDVRTGIVERPNSYYATPLKSETAWMLFVELVGIVHGSEMPTFIKACNRAAARKQLVTDADRRDAVLQYTGIIPAPTKSAKPHNVDSCCCTKCLMTHVQNGCRKVGCKVCFA